MDVFILLGFMFNMILSIGYIYNMIGVRPWIRKLGLLSHIPATFIFGLLLGASL